MPIYEYICKDCGHEFEKFVPRMNSVVECKKCSGSNIEKKFSVFGTTATSQIANKCSAAESCPAASTCGCHGKCGCH